TVIPCLFCLIDMRTSIKLLIVTILIALVFSAALPSTMAMSRCLMGKARKVAGGFCSAVYKKYYKNQPVMFEQYNGYQCTDRLPVGSTLCVP
ncbi:unnamed protein product, partial [Closterium sp. NIES-54]